MMKSKQLRASFFLWLLLFIFPSSFFCATYGMDQIEFKFYDIGSNDTLTTSVEKINQNGFQCIKGKASFLDIKKSQDGREIRKPNEKIEEALAIDNASKKIGNGLPYEEMPIDVMDCNKSENNSFLYTTFYFSKYNQKILAIKIGTEKMNYPAAELRGIKRNFHLTPMQSIEEFF